MRLNQFRRVGLRDGGVFSNDGKFDHTQSKQANMRLLLHPAGWSLIPTTGIILPIIIGICGNCRLSNGEDYDCLDDVLPTREDCIGARKPAEMCETSEQCVNMDTAALQQHQYHCIANLCQLPPAPPPTPPITLPKECAAGHVAIGSECHPFAVTGGECAHPLQCLAGSICIWGKCRGSCEVDQVFVEDSCVDYEGGGCIARSCVERKCPRAFASCNYVPQRSEYLCCERQIRPVAHCPVPNSTPEISRLTNDVVNCLQQPCGPGFNCQFVANNNNGGDQQQGEGNYICCSTTTIPNNGNGGGKRRSGMGKMLMERRKKGMMMMGKRRRRRIGMLWWW